MDALTNADDDHELPVERQPMFTVQDAQRELATLTIQELTELQSDLTGIQAITNGFSGLGFGGDSGGINVYGGESSPPAPLSTNDKSLLVALDQHMTTLPAQSTAAYFRATTKCPDEISDERKMLFLQCEENNVPLAAQRLALYWQCRLDGFGDDRCFEPMTLAGAMRDEITNMAISGMYQLMPNTDAAGRAIIYFRMARKDLSRYSVRQEFMWLTYLLDIAVQHRCLQGRGFVLLIDASNGTRKHYSSQGIQFMQHALKGFPIRQRSIHVCNTSPLFNYVLFPVAMRVVSKNVRLRTRLHQGSGDDFLRSLATFHLPPDRLPSDMGGSVVLDNKQFLIDRIYLEASRAGLNLRVSETENVNQADRIGSTLSSASPNYNDHGQAPLIDGPSAGGVHVAAPRGTKANSNVSTAEADIKGKSTSNTAIAATGTCAVGGRHLPLSSPSDEAYLSPLVCLIRSQIEMFSATEADVHARAALGGIVRTIKPGRVGIRCIHCWDRPAKERANGAVGYPASIRVLNQAVRNWQRFHWGICLFIPPSAREEFERLNSGKRTHSSKMSKEYWIHRCEEMGLVDASASSLEDSEESEGIYFEADARTLGLRVLMSSELKEGTKKAGMSGKRKTDASGDSNKEDIGDESFRIIAAKKAAVPIRTSGLPVLMPPGEKSKVVRKKIKDGTKNADTGSSDASISPLTTKKALLLLSCK